VLVLAVFMLAVLVASIVGPPPPSTEIMAASGFGAYLLFAAPAGWVDRGPTPPRV
jgi:hypothetical protein